MSSKPLRIGIVAGEASGDVLAGGMLKYIREQHPDAIIEGIGGPLMQAQGCRSLFDMEELSVMGLVEVLSRIRRLLFIRKSLFNHFAANPPDVFIGVDAPDFNLNLEKKLKQQGIKTVHYVSPTVWAWRENRIFGIAESTNLVLSVLPFEKQVYDKHGFACQFVGHTMADDVPINPDKKAARDALGLNASDTVLAVLPGSRGSEINMLGEVFFRAVQTLHKRYPGLKVVVPAANQKRYEQIQHILDLVDIDVSVSVLNGQSRQAMIAADAILLASGTATLEAMLCKRPMVVAYRLNWLTHQMMKRLYKAKYFALPNLLADEEIVPELLQEEVNADTLSEKLDALLSGREQQDIGRFEQLHHELKQNADKQSAQAVLSLINET